MRLSRCLYLAALAFGLCGMAKADPLDFKMTVLDGDTPPPTTYTITNVDGSPFTVNFSLSACQSFSIPPSPAPTPTGCFYFTNVSNVTLTNLDLTFGDTTGLGGQPATCDTSPVTTAFANSSCTSPTPGNDNYNLQFYGGAGVLPNPPYPAMPYTYTIEVFGAAASDFPTDISATLTATPEPSSVLLFGTGILMMGGAFFLKRHPFVR